MENEQVLPFGMTWEDPVFRRARSLSKALFNCLDATITLVRGDRVWRSIDPEGKMAQRERAACRVITAAKAIWFEDVTLDAELADGPTVVGAPYIRFYAAAPIILSDGSVMGVLNVVDPTPRAEDRRLLARLQDLANMIADECNRAQERAQGGKELRTTRDVLTALVDVVPVSLMLCDTEMKLIAASRTWMRNLDLTPETALGRCLYDLYPAFEKYRNGYERALSGETIQTERAKWWNPDGEIRWLRNQMTPWYDQDGKIGGLINAALDITDTVEALKRSEQAEMRMNLACEMANLHVWELDFEHRKLLLAGVMEEAQHELFGRSLTYDDLYNNIHSTIHPDDRQAIGAEWDRAVAEGRKFIPEYRIARPDDLEIWAACSVKLVRDRDGRPRALIGAMQNITERKQAELALMHAKEDAEAANLAKSSFLATMSHEIRTPLNGVLGMVQAMETDDLTDTQRERLSIIRQSGQTLLAILNDVLDISKIEAGKLELETAPFDIEEVALGAHAAFTELANRKGLDFNLVVADEACGVYVGDSTRLRQILYNLVSNAVKFTEEGQVAVRVERSEGGLIMRVTDTGAGIPSDRLPKLFDKFEQADASTTRRYGGTGLGLAICRDLAGLMGGRISATSTVGKGSIFQVDLPLERISDSRSAAKATPAPANTQTTAIETPALRILAAEDNAVNQLVLKTLLHQAGIEPVVVANGAEALEAWREGHWDMILMDVQMPVMDGPSATMAIRSDEAKTGRPRTPIIALTANAMSHQVAEYRACGMDDFVAKPIEIGQLFAAMERVLNAGQQDQILAS